MLADITSKLRFRERLLCLPEDEGEKQHPSLTERFAIWHWSI